MQDLPTGEVTFLFTDIEGSTRLLEYLGGDVYGQVLSEHHRSELTRPKWEQERYEGSVAAYRAHREDGAADPQPEMHSVGSADAVELAIEHLLRYSNAI